MPETTYSAYSFDITNNYICASYEDGKNGYCYFVYEKQKGIVADAMYSKYSYIEDILFKEATAEQ